jgi:hypothetical protein
MMCEKVDVHSHSFDQHNAVTFKVIFFLHRYVKREIRSLTDDDRERFLVAASTMWQLNSSAGKLKYGLKYSAIADFVSLHSMSSDDIMCDGFHEGQTQCNAVFLALIWLLLRIMTVKWSPACVMLWLS